MVSIHSYSYTNGNGDTHPNPDAYSYTLVHSHTNPDVNLDANTDADENGNSRTDSDAYAVTYQHADFDRDTDAQCGDARPEWEDLPTHRGERNPRWVNHLAPILGSFSANIHLPLSPHFYHFLTTFKTYAILVLNACQKVS